MLRTIDNWYELQKDVDKKRHYSIREGSILWYLINIKMKVKAAIHKAWELRFKLLIGGFALVFWSVLIYQMAIELCK